MAILLCSRNETVLEKWWLALSPQWQTHQAMSMKELHTMLERFQIDILLIHRNMIDTDQLREICGLSNRGLKVFVVSDRPNDHEGTVCLQLGCVGYANTYTRPSRMVAAMEAVQTGLVWIGNSLMQHLIKGLASPVEEGDVESAGENENPLLSSLSRREYQIARLVADGMHNSEIANVLDITERTVKAHLSSIYAKTHTKGRLNLALLINTS